jgi:hypothetical protein
MIQIFLFYDTFQKENKMSTKMNVIKLSKPLTILLIGSLLFSGCTKPAPASTPAIETPVSSTGTTVTFGRLTISVPSEVASGASGREIDQIIGEDDPIWQKTPGHQQVMFGDYYVLQGKFHQPKIYVYPAEAYAELVPAASESIHRLNDILKGTSESVSEGQLPSIPFFNAQKVFASNIMRIPFQNGEGVRFLTEYAQYFAPVNNHELFYNFHGVTLDGAYYIMAIFPITVPSCAETSELTAPIPPGGITFPDINTTNVDFQDYYKAVSDLLNTTPPDAFSPSINQLDLLIKSIQIAQ